MAVEITSNFNCGFRFPIDSRTVKTTYRELLEIKTLFDGLTCWVSSEQKEYRCHKVGDSYEWRENAVGDGNIFLKQNGVVKAAFSVNQAEDQEIDFAQLGIGSGVPKGIICMWSGSMADVPEGWHLCDGTEGTPDLRNRFVVCIGDKYSIGNKGGSDSQTLQLENLPAHSHGINIDNTTSATNRLTTDEKGSHVHIVAINGGSHSHSYTYQSYTAEMGESSGKGANKVRGITSKGISTDTSYVSHSHTADVVAAGAHSHSVYVTIPAHKHTATISNVGKNQGFENRPAYYALAYIMKISDEGGSTPTTGTDSLKIIINLDLAKVPIGTFAIYGGLTNEKYTRGFIYEKYSNEPENSWRELKVMNVIQ